MAGFKDKMGKLKDWMITDDENSDEEYDSYEDEYDDSYEEYDDNFEEYEEDTDITSTSSSYAAGIAASRVADYQAHNQMKVVIVEPKVYDDAATIADHLKLRKTVIVNLENMTQQNTKKSIFDFMNGAVYVLDGSIQRVSKSIFILAPKNVDVDENIKKELESKAIFPWQSR